MIRALLTFEEAHEVADARPGICIGADRGWGTQMAADLESSRRGETEAANAMLAFAAGVVQAPNVSDRTGEDAPDDFDRNVATIAAHIAGLALSLPTLGRIAYGLELSGDAAWGALAEELRQNYPDLSDLHFAGVVLTTVEAIRECALTMPAGTHVDSSARLKLFAMGLGVARERREAIRALLVQDIDTLLGLRRTAYLSSVKGNGAAARAAKC
jgi:hypothetical protein